MIRWALILSLLFAPSTFAGGDDFIETNDSIKLSNTRRLSHTPLSEELVDTIAKKVEEKKETLKKCDLSTTCGSDIYPILKSLEKCARLEEIDAKQVNTKTALALSTLKIIADGTVSLGSFIDTHPRRTMRVDYSNYNIGAMCDRAQRCVCKYLGLTNPFDYHTKEFADRLAANSDALDTFLKKCLAKKIFILSDPNFEAILDAQK